jgi:hypothetical protein
MPVRRAIHGSLTVASAGIQARHIGFHPGFIDENQARCIQIRLVFYPFLPSLFNVRAILFACPKRFF